MANCMSTTCHPMMRFQWWKGYLRMQNGDLKYDEQCAVACIAISNRNLDLLCKGPLDVQHPPAISN